jgi:hypothetical protein
MPFASLVGTTSRLMKLAPLSLGAIGTYLPCQLHHLASIVQSGVYLSNKFREQVRHTSHN